MSQLTTLKHPLIDAKMTILRDTKTPPHDFRRRLNEIAAIMSADVFRHLKTQTCRVKTPLEETDGKTITTPTPCIVSILRAGNGLAYALLSIFPEAAFGHLGMERDASTHKAKPYYEKLPQDIAKRQVVLIDPMLATGGSAVMAAERLKSHGVKDILFACLIAAPEGIQNFHQKHPDIPIITATLDRELNENCYILPGLGDVGDRIYNT